MLAIIDYRTNDLAIEKLYQYVDDILLFQSQNKTYESISGHPDIFLYQDYENIIVAPNSPNELFQFLKKYKIKYNLGIKNIGKNLEDSVLYNCISTEDLFLHKKGYTDKLVLEYNIDKKIVDLPQAYTRCSLMHIGNNSFITSDKGVEKELIKNSIECFYFSPEKIKIVEHKNGFLGGTVGMFDNKIFFNGNISLHKDGLKLKEFIESKGLEIILLHNDFLYDGGSIFFIK